MIWKEKTQMPSISKIRLANVIFEEGNKRYNDETFLFDGHNGAVLLENGGGKTVLIQTALQAMIPHTELAGRKIGKTLSLDSSPAHIAIEWIINEKPRRYVVTAVTLFLSNNKVDSLRYVYEYQHGDPNGIESIPFIREVQGGKRPTDRGEIQDYYSMMKDKSLSAATFTGIGDYRNYIEDNYQIIGTEWDSIVKINSTEGGVETFFESCKTTNQLFDRLLIPTVENAIVGHDETLFASLFEQRYTSFKNYQRLKETIEENKRIQQELVDYASTFEQLHHQEQAFLETKQKAKGIWEHTLNQKQVYLDEKRGLIEREEQWKKKKHHHEVKVSSFTIAEKRVEQEQAEEVYKRASLLLEEAKSKTVETKGTYAALNFAKYVKEEKEAADRLQFIQEEIAAFEEQEDVEEIKDRIANVEQALNGAFKEELEEINKEHLNVEREKQPLETEVKNLEHQEAVYSSEKESLQEEIIKRKTQIESREKDSNKLLQSLLSHTEQEKVEEEYPKWETRYQGLDNERVHLKSESKRLLQELEEMRERKEALQSEMHQNELKEQHVKQQLEGLQTEEEQLKVSLSMLRSQWQDIDSIHLREQSVVGLLESHLEKQRNEEKRWLDKERVALRYVDDYGKQETFFSDRYLSEQIEIWKNQLDYVETGIDYLSQFPKEKQSELKRENLWASIIVTTTKSKPQLLKRLEQVSDRMTFPILVLTTEEAMTIADVEKHTWVVPGYWDQNLDGDQFTEWKERLSSQANEITKEKEKTKIIIGRWERTLQQFRDFLTKYPYESVREWGETLNNLYVQSESFSTRFHQLSDQIKEIEQQRTNHINRIEEIGEERAALARKLEDSRQYFSYQKEMKTFSHEMREYQEQWDDVEGKVKQVIRVMKRYGEDIAEKDTRIQDLKVIVRSLENNQDYQEVSHLPAKYTDESKEILIEKRRTLKLEEANVTKQISALYEKLKSERLSMQHAKSRLEEIERDYPHVDKLQSFPADGNNYLERLYQQIKELEAALDVATTTNNTSEKNKEIKKALVTQEEANFHKDFPNDNIYLFTNELTEEKLGMETEHAELLKLKSYIEQEVSRVGKEITQLETAERTLENFIEGYHFNAPGIAVIALEEQAKVDFQYEAILFAEKITEELRVKKQKVETEEERVVYAKDQFRTFCRSNISDRKLQQMAIEGVEQKRTFEDVIGFKQNMFKSIQRITKYANEHIRKSDEELQLFINQMHSHLEKLVDELEEIPKKTKVNVDGWKQIYSFSIPKWEPEEGKLRIRNHTERIIKRLDNDKYRNDTGQQDMAKVRLDLEKWLGSKELLREVMDRDVLKVHCRKVTNDNQISTRSYSWEQSNVWSGGEKWSKNMTLFLGILKYVAEKKKSNLTKQSVLLDNPFGKASSDHVLSPVFFIAEQLDFQIIALTAHAEGKFLQDYFPIIYSCRLRASKDLNKQVMTTEKWLHHAYFQDHEPTVIDRLGQTEQLDLFGEGEDS